MARYRIVQINGEIQKAVSEIINQDIKNPIIDNQVISVIKVDTSNDMSQAKVYISILADKDKQKEIFSEIESSKGFIRHELASKLNLRKTPKLVFIYDESLEEGSKILSIIEDMKKKGEL